MRRRAAAILCAGVVLVGGAVWARAGGAAAAPSAWPTEVLERAARLPVQDGGRVKPLDTFAGHTLLALNHRQKVAVEGDRSLTSLEWLLDVLFRPEAARGYRCFRIENDEVLDDLGLSHEGRKKADRYSFDEIAAAHGKLRERAAKYGKIDAKERTPVEGDLVNLAHGVAVMESLLHFLDFARVGMPISPEAEKLKKVFAGQDRVSIFDLVEKLDAVRALLPKDDPHAGVAGAPRVPGAAAPTDPDAKGAALLWQAAEAYMGAADKLALIPPAGPRDEAAEWITPAEVLIQRETVGEAQVKLVLHLAGMAQAMAETPDRLETFSEEMKAYSDGVISLATERGEYEKVPLEVTLRRVDPFYKSLLLYVFAFLVLAVSWAIPNRWIPRVAWVLLSGAVLLAVGGIVVRCILRDRPPISTLYDTILFISTVGTIVFMVVEWIQRRGIALALAPVIGGLTLFIANRYEMMKGEDTMPQLVAVLDTNFWLALHVTCINLGYCGGVLAALTAHVTVLGRFLNRGTPDFHRAVHRMTYGMLCFGLLFSVVGTILGGVWANDSWGRFWGWDPKENGALMICLADIAILHARMGGLIKPFGVAMSAIGAGGVIAFSWWGVNLIGIGLHAYGFTAGILTGLLVYYGVEAVVLALGAWAHFRAPSASP